MSGRLFRPRPPRRRRGRPVHYRVRPLLEAYLTCLAVVPVTWAAAHLASGSMPLAIAAAAAAHLACGVVLSRAIGRELDWNEYTADLASAPRWKLWLVVTWPLVAPAVLVQLAVMRYL